jgi:hypothetical protein
LETGKKHRLLHQLINLPLTSMEWAGHKIFSKNFVLQTSFITQFSVSDISQDLSRLLTACSQKGHTRLKYGLWFLWTYLWKLPSVIFIDCCQISKSWQFLSHVKIGLLQEFRKFRAKLEYWRFLWKYIAKMPVALPKY